MKTIEINGHLRKEVGKKEAKNLRREGQVPCVVYGGSDNVHFFVDHRELNKLVYTPDVYLVKLNLDGTEIDAVMREVQYHPVSDAMLHMDFVRVEPSKPITLRLPVKLNGNSIGVKNGGVLRRNAKMLKVRALLKDIPEYIEIDITDMRIGHSKKVGDLDFPGIEFLETDNRVVVAVKTSRKAIVDEEEEDAEGAEGAEGEEGEGGSSEGGSEEAAES